MRLVFLSLLLLFSIGCSCETKSAFKLVWKKHIKKAYNWVLADNEASKYRDREDVARAYLKELRELPDVYAVSKKLVKDGFRWHAENVDFTSYAWVTIARKRGDCDDFMSLWMSVLKYWTGRTKRVSVSSTHGRNHAMLLFYSDAALYLLSNMYVKGRGSPGDEDKLVRLFYGDATDCWLKY